VTVNEDSGKGETRKREDRKLFKRQSETDCGVQSRG
jgi:hypothetical protein